MREGYFVLNCIPGQQPVVQQKLNFKEFMINPFLNFTMSKEDSNFWRH